VSWTKTGKAPTALTATEYSSSSTPGGKPPSSGFGPDLTDAIPTLGEAAPGTVVRSDTLFPYPELLAYKDSGNVDDASSYIGDVSTVLLDRSSGSGSSTPPWCGTTPAARTASEGTWHLGHVRSLTGNNRLRHVGGRPIDPAGSIPLTSQEVRQLATLPERLSNRRRTAASSTPY
jgi:hypothetical protein